MIALTRKVSNKKRRRKIAPWVYLLFWTGVGIASYVLISIGSPAHGSKIPFGILTGITLGFLVMCARYKMKPALCSLACLAVGQLASVSIFDFSSFTTVLCACTLVMLASYPAWFWLIRTKWEPSAARWALYFVLVMIGLLAVPSRQLLYIVLVVGLIVMVQRYMSGNLTPIRTSPQNRRLAHNTRAQAYSDKSLQTLMLERARRMALRRQAQQMVSNHQSTGSAHTCKSAGK